MNRNLQTLIIILNRKLVCGLFNWANSNNDNNVLYYNYFSVASEISNFNL